MPWVLLKSPNSGEIEEGHLYRGAGQAGDLGEYRREVDEIPVEGQPGPPISLLSGKLRPAEPRGERGGCGVEQPGDLGGQPQRLGADGSPPAVGSLLAEQVVDGRAGPERRVEPHQQIGADESRQRVRRAAGVAPAAEGPLDVGDVSDQLADERRVQPEGQQPRRQLGRRGSERHAVEGKARARDEPTRIAGEPGIELGRRERVWIEDAERLRPARETPQGERVTPGVPPTGKRGAVTVQSRKGFSEKGACLLPELIGAVLRRDRSEEVDRFGKDQGHDEPVEKRPVLLLQVLLFSRTPGAPGRRRADVGDLPQVLCRDRPAVSERTAVGPGPA